ncbi:hypothetical protein [Klebsiella quasipneumoniae]|uniref:hypothetical protein n=1 Tax=Klebsiella quasipneumoniae TaxID=1463165 RepID=UPI001F5E85A4|nr:hypothetical protein [Klebsiella quasipneumoniae]
MNAYEKNGVFHCDCGFSWLRGESGNHNCADGLREKVKQLAAESVALKNVFGPGDAVLNFLTIALRHTTYDQIDLDDVSLAFKMSLPETPATDRIVSWIKAEGVEQAANECYGAGYIYETLLAYAQQMRKGAK